MTGMNFAALDQITPDNVDSLEASVQRFFPLHADARAIALQLHLFLRSFAGVLQGHVEPAVDVDLRGGGYRRQHQRRR